MDVFREDSDDGLGVLNGGGDMGFDFETSLSDEGSSLFLRIFLGKILLMVLMF